MKKSAIKWADISRVSEATVKNWEKLSTNIDGGLTSRANKLRSTKRVEPVEYMFNPGNVISIRAIVDYIEDIHGQPPDCNEGSNSHWPPKAGNARLRGPIRPQERCLLR